ncbi:Outer membrane protein beta-barrel domain-containing protein [Fibrobacter intestinalis]|uniref:Outer membrane protein beta-barrel domain-containing protein n=1 Tax=Fibrobacter intestinalis TaxID=28122 RepID=A0A1M6TE35_9BACT|nr:porin family protein [Fibrobacter intestinalis]SHK55134.1 Outer membrane protein beta-barrel domain-containing protein [Fibrobacter intestinalis]
MNRIFKIFALVAVAATLSFAGGEFHFGARAAGTFGTWWGDDTEDIPWGFGFNAGLTGGIEILPIFAVTPEIDIALRRVSEDDATVRQWYLEIPVLARVTPIPQFYLEAGPTFAFNLSSEIEEEVGDVEVTADLDDYISTFEFGLALGAGWSIIPNLDVNFRLMLGLTSIAEDYEEDGYSYSPDVQNLRLSIGATYWFL